MRRLNPEHIPHLIDLLNQAPFFRLLNIRLMELGRGFATLEMDLEDKHRNPFGVIHGGSYSSLIDTAAYWSAYCQMEPEASFVTVDVDVNIMAAAEGGRLTARGECLKIGRTMCLTQAVVLDQQDRIISQGNSKMVNIPGKQAIGQVVETIGGDSLPPKFLD